MPTAPKWFPAWRHMWVRALIKGGGLAILCFIAAGLHVAYGGKTEHYLLVMLIPLVLVGIGWRLRGWWERRK